MPFTPNRSTLVPAALGAVMALTLAIYWIGLNGPFIFDDNLALASVQQWSRGQVNLAQVMFGNTSWATHRAVAMGSLALNSWALGFNPHSLKLGNLLLHLGIGALAYLFLAALLRRDALLSSRARPVAALIAAVWLLHPLNVSTVLYAVQRMAQVATLFCVLGLWLYVILRERIEQGSQRAWLGLFVGIPLLTFLGIQGKQNAAVLPALCLVVELAYFHRPRTWPRLLSVFYVLGLLLPLILAAVVMLIRPELLMKGYGEYEFTPVQRLLSEARVLCSYLQALLIPHPPSMGVYTDDFLASTGLLSPPSTLVALTFLLAATVAAWKVRRSLPSVFAGWCFYLVAHSVEGTILPLELYYEHRNYLPAFGIFLACAGLVAAAARALSQRGIRVLRVGAVTGTCLLAVLALQTHGRARVWSNMYTLVESARRSHPDSPRAAITYMGMAMDAGNHELARSAADEILRTSSQPRVRGLVMLFRIRMDCTTQGRATASDLTAAIDTLPHHLDLTTALSLGYVKAGFAGGKCTGITPLELAQAMELVAERATRQPDVAWPKAFLRHNAADLYADVGDWPSALKLSRKVWTPTTEPSAATILVEALLHHGCLAEAEQVYQEAKARARPFAADDTAGLKDIRDIIEAGKKTLPPTASPSCRPSPSLQNAKPDAGNSSTTAQSQP